MGLEWGGEGCGGQENKNNTLFTEAPGGPVYSKDGDCFVYMEVLIKILMARDTDFETKMGFRL